MNDQLVSVGETIVGVKLVSVDNSGIFVEFEGGEYFIAKVTPASNPKKTKRQNKRTYGEI